MSISASASIASENFTFVSFFFVLTVNAGGHKWALFRRSKPSRKKTIAALVGETLYYLRLSARITVSFETNCYSKILTGSFYAFLPEH